MQTLLRSHTLHPMATGDTSHGGEPSTTTAAASSSSEYVAANISPQLLPALVALCRAKPEDPVTWLAEYLRAHKLPPPVVSSPLAELQTILLQECRHVEPRLTKVITDIAAQFPGAKLLDLEHKFKSAASLTMKLARFSNMVSKKTPTRELTEVNKEILALHTTEPGRAGAPIVVDALRYTLCVPTPQYAACARAVRHALTEEHGFEQIDNKNFWPGVQTYRGINDVYAVPLLGSKAWGSGTGGKAKELFFEVQLHTPESVALKHAVHPTMKHIQGTKDLPDDTKAQLVDEMLAHVHACPIPDGALDLPKEVVRPKWW